MKDGSRPWLAFTDDVFLLTARQPKVIETGLQEGFLKPLKATNGRAGKSTRHRRNSLKNAEIARFFGVF
jgi:hypothetical protein